MDEPVLYRETFVIVGDDFEHGGDAAAAVKLVLKDLGLDPAVIRRLSIANFEAEMNVIMYASEARMDLVITPSEVRVMVADCGPGIEHIELAMQEGYSTATAEMRARGFGAGMGLPNIKRSTDWFEVESTFGVGTTLRYAGEGEPGKNGRPPGDLRVVLRVQAHWRSVSVLPLSLRSRMAPFDRLRASRRRLPSLLRRFKQGVERGGILGDYKRHQTFMSRGEKARAKMKCAERMRRTRMARRPASTGR